MRSSIRWSIITAAALAFAACSSSDTKKIDGSVKGDGIKKSDGTITGDGLTGTDGKITVPEGSTKTDQKGDQKKTGDGTAVECDPAKIGKSCARTTAEADCGTGHTCLLTGADTGVCTCECTPDNPATALVNEDSCPGAGTKTQCGSVRLQSGSTLNSCFKFCTPKIGSNDCDPKLACEPRSGGQLGLFGKQVCAFTGCAADTDCPVATSTKCSVTAKDCPAGQECLRIITGVDEGLCGKPGKCDTKSGLCDSKPANLSKAGTKVGDACKDDTECDVNQNCFIEIDSRKYLKAEGQPCAADTDCCSNSCTLPTPPAKTDASPAASDASAPQGKCKAGAPCRVSNRNGYCTVSSCSAAATLTNAKCPAGSTCNSLYDGGLCQKTCTTADAATCRGNAKDFWGDYECRMWNNLQIGGAPISQDAVCDFGPGLACDFAGTAAITCEILGQVPDATKTKLVNPTNMGCRDLFTGAAKTNAKDPSGFCLDDTGSGTAKRPAN